MLYILSLYFFTPKMRPDLYILPCVLFDPENLSCVVYTLMFTCVLLDLEEAT